MDILGDLRRDRSTDTGLSLISGDEICSLSDLPEHHAELHVFTNSDAASAFVDGLQMSKAGNALVWTWQPHTHGSNRTVIVARLDEPRPDAATLQETVPVIPHAGHSYDSAAYARFSKESLERHKMDKERIDAKTKSVRSLLEAAGMKVVGYGDGWVKTDDIDVQFGPDGYSTSGCHIQFPMTLPLADVENICAVRAAEKGIRFDCGDREFRAGPFVTPAEAIASAGVFHAAEKACLADIKDVLFSIFAASMKMTAARRRFLTAAEDGFHVRVHRCDQSAWANGIKIGKSEMNALERIGWIEITGFKGIVTESGREAMKVGAPVDNASAFGPR